MSASAGPSAWGHSSVPGHEVSRRSFLKGLVAIGGTCLAVSTTQAAWPPAAVAARPPRAFEFVHDEATSILIYQAAVATRLDIRVRHAGELVERFKSAAPHRLDRLDSAYFTVRYIDPPAA